MQVINSFLFGKDILVDSGVDWALYAGKDVVSTGKIGEKCKSSVYKRKNAV